MPANKVPSASYLSSRALHERTCGQAVHRSSEGLLELSCSDSTFTGYNAAATTKELKYPSKDDMAIYWKCTYQEGAYKLRPDSISV